MVLGVCQHSKAFAGSDEWITQCSHRRRTKLVRYLLLSRHRQDTRMESRHSPVFQRLLSTQWWAAGFEHTMPAPLCHTASVLYRTSPGSHRLNCPLSIARDRCYTYVILLGQPAPVLRNPLQAPQNPDTPRKPQPQHTTPGPILAMAHHPHG